MPDKKPAKRKRAPHTPKERAEAVRFYRSRVAVTPAQYKALNSKAKRHAFTVSGNLQQSTVQGVLTSLTKALKTGQTLTAWKKELREHLTRKYLDKKSSYLKTVYQTAVQTALQAGRYDELVNDPQPYRCYDAVLDDRTTDLCRGLNGTVVRADHPMLERMWPPLHWHCRTTVRAISAKEAIGRGINYHAPKGYKPYPGFGAAPPVAEDYEPPADDFDPDVLDIARAKKRQPKAS